jgi:pyrroline-5-carboxylate reductase
MSDLAHTGSWLFIGAGNMAEAIVTGATAGGAVSPQRVAGYQPEAEVPRAFGGRFNEPGEAAAWLREQDASGNAAAVVLGVKPQMFGAVAEVWRPLLDPGPSRLVVSILAGTRATKVASGLGGRARVVRVMPNTPIRVGMGMTAVCSGPRAGEADLARVEALFGASGRTMRIDEQLMDAFTALAGSGPAYVFYLAEAMAEAAEQLGFDRERALTIVRQTVAGAGELLARSPETPRALRTAVTSKGGTTAAGTGTLDESGVHDAVVRAVHAARHRGVELAGG